ncbi:MAG: seryl-tRNA synthetase, partial [Kiritimatiellia bacterium]
MLDQKLLRSNPELVATALLKRGFILDIDALKVLDDARKVIQVKTESLQQERNTRSKNIGKAKASGEDITPLLKEVDNLKAQLTGADEELKRLQEQLDTIMLAIPNMPVDEVPEGKSEDDNIELRRWGTPRTFDFEVKDHVDLGAAIGDGFNGLDFDVASKLTGSRFAVMRGGIARLHRALIQFMLNTHIEEHQYQEVYVPFLVNKASLFGTGQLPKFEEDLFKTNDERELYLIPTAEVPVTNLLRDELLPDDKQLPLKLVCHTPCFRSEAGSHGRDTRGMIRQHQFEKVELVNFVKAEDSAQALEDLTAC